MSHPGTRPRRRGQRGFTLLELMVTLMVTVFGLMGMLALHNALGRGIGDSSRSQEAVVVGSRTLEELRSKRIDEMMRALTGSTTAAPPIDVPTYRTELGRNGVSYGVAVQVTLAGAALWRLRVEVSWEDDRSGETRMLPLELLRTQQEAL